MIDHRAADPEGRISGEGVAAILEAVRGLDQSDHADLDQILDIDRGGDAAVDVPGDLADQRHMGADQRVRACARAAAVGRGDRLGIIERHAAPPPDRLSGRCGAGAAKRDASRAKARVAGAPGKGLDDAALPQHRLAHIGIGRDRAGIDQLEVEEAGGDARGSDRTSAWPAASLCDHVGHDLEAVDAVRDGQRLHQRIGVDERGRLRRDDDQRRIGRGDQRQRRRLDARSRCR